MGKRKDSWRHDEKDILCQAWITITTDGAIRTNQSADIMWEHISAEYNAQKPANRIERLPDSYKARWKVFSPLCTKWRESLTQAEADHRSGENKEDDLMRARSIYYDKVGTDFVFDHCCRYLKNTIKFGETPFTDALNSRIPTPINLEEDEAHNNEAEPTTTRQTRPQGQKVQKLAKKRGKQQDADGLRIQMQKAQEQSEREYLQRQQQFEQVKQLEQRVSDDHIMMVDLSTLDTPRKRGYWERRQQKIINREERTSSIPMNPQDQAPTEDQPPTQGDNRNLANYVPVHETQWIN
uniref:uncharacterized protein LOC101311890 n=1 Tax=Fragaria vesca subsp. vesca TaxID=101020 RepID=UPI0005CA38BD|nr:PREDICTED: uncharacterized protein LOC101311890 [Fragaria vesca subsp. vesca]